MKLEQGIIFATGNKGKFETLKLAFQENNIPTDCLIQKPLDLIEIQSDSVAEIARYKAKQAWEALQTPLIVHDGGLNIPALNGFPGPYTKYMSDKIGSEGFHTLLKDKKDKSIKFYNCVTFVDERGHINQFEEDTGNMLYISDYIAEHPHPKQWSDLWRIIVPKGLGYTKTLAEFSDEELTEYWRKRAARQIENAYGELTNYLKENMYINHAMQKEGV